MHSEQPERYHEPVTMIAKCLEFALVCVFGPWCVSRLAGSGPAPPFRKQQTDHKLQQR
jgi:hypothetical protein